MEEQKRPGLVQRILRKAGWAAPFLVAGVLLLVGVGGPTAVTYSNTPEFCSSCHSMSDEFASWKVSPHADAATCIECHSDPGALGEMAAHVKGVRMLYMTIANVEPTLVMDHKIPNDYCEKCHKMEVEQPKGVMVNHQKHLKEGVTCQDCHAGLVHKANEFKPGNERFHNICIGCHAEKSVKLETNGSTGCTACHSVLTEITPADHGGHWMANHGKSSSKQNCGECHLAASAGSHGAMSQPASFAVAQQGDQCASCHQTTMPHPTSYLQRHGADALSQGAGVCANCHSPLSPVTPKPDHAAANFCSNCHSGVTMPHGENWMSRHGAAAGTSDNPACIVCHSSGNRVRPAARYAASDYCVSCHAGQQMPHTEEFTASHGQHAVKSGISCLTCHSSLNPVAPQAGHASASYCAACHDQTKHEAVWIKAHGAQSDQLCFTCHSEDKGGKNACQACHQGDPKDKNQFHSDPYWFVTHRRAAKEQGEQACYKCHAEVQPSCSKCHSNR